jgi:WD40 repeat protein
MPPRALGAIVLACSAALCAACAARTSRASAASQATGIVSYNQVHAIFRESCEHCHNADKAKGGLLMDSYEALLAGGEHGSPIVAGNSASSRLVQMLEGATSPRMPYKEDPLPASQVALIRRWIDAGAPGPAASASKGPAAGGTPTAAPDAEITVPTVKPTVAVVGAVTAVAFDPAARRMAVGGYQSGHLLGLTDRKWTAALDGHADLVRAAAFSPDGKLLALAGGPSGRFGEIKIWNVEAAAPRLLSTLRGHTDAILSIAFSPANGTLASASYDKLVKLWDVAAGKEIRSLKEHSDAVYTVAFTGDGRHVVSGAGDRTIKVWEVESGRRLVTISDPLDSVYAVAVHPSGGQIAAAGADRMIRTWAWEEGFASAGTSPVLRASTFAHGEAVLRLAYSKDGSTLVSAGADRVIKVWDAATLREKMLLEPQPDWVMGLALSGDGKWLAAGRYDGTVGLYDLANGRSGEQFVVPK